MHQHRLTGLQPAPDRQREVHRQVVEQHARARLESHVVRQLEHALGRQYRDFGHAAGEHREADNPVSGTHLAVIRRRSNHSGDLGAEHEWRLRAVLVTATG